MCEYLNKFQLKKNQITSATSSHYIGDDDKRIDMARHGIIGEYCSTREVWLAYTERMQQYFAANDVRSADKQRAILLSAVGASTYQLIKSLLAPNKPSERSFDELVKLVQDHHQPPPSESVQRYTFNTRSRKQGESITMYVAELRRLAEHCNYRDSLNDMLRDRLVCGVNDQRVQRRLLAEGDLTFQKAYDIAIAMEAADRNARELQGTARVQEDVHRVYAQKKGGGARGDVRCYRCLGNHNPTECKFRKSECHHCKKMGHLARACRDKLGSQEETRYIISEEELTRNDEYSLF